MKASDQYEVYKKWSLENGLPIRSYNNFCHLRQFFESLPAPLTEWQRKRIIEKMKDGSMLAITRDDAIACIESILSEPEPPKYEPKEGEAVLLKMVNGVWRAGVFQYMEGAKYRAYDFAAAYENCRPFDAALVGKVTND